MNIGDADSDDDEPYQGEPMLEVKDPYVLRSLPVLIGSQAFHENDNVGLVDLPSGIRSRYMMSMLFHRPEAGLYTPVHLFLCHCCCLFTSLLYRGKGRALITIVQRER